MKLGLVRYLNARPLDWGFRLRARTDPGLELLDETPSRLIEELLAGRLDAALVSSVEYLRNRDRLDGCTSVGVCFENRVDSLFYIRKPSPEYSDHTFYKQIPKRLLVDAGSRSSVALLQVLLHGETGIRFPVEACDPRRIPDRLEQSDGGLLIGDAAMEFMEGERARDFLTKDLAQWWHEQEQLPFVTALWAYPGERPIPDSFFEESLEEGLRNLPEIIRKSHYKGAEIYLAKTLHYRLTELDKKSLEVFRRRLSELDLL